MKVFFFFIHIFLISRIFFFLFFFIVHSLSPSFKDYETFDLKSAKDILVNNKFDNLKRTVLYIPGYNAQLDDDNVQLVVSSYLKRNDHNLIFLDWVALSIGNYVTEVVPNAMRVII